MSIVHWTCGVSNLSLIPISLLGLYDQTSINSINVGATVSPNQQDAEILGTEPSNGSYGSMYSERSSVLGDDTYIEFVPKVISDANNFRFGIETQGAESPNQLAGSVSGFGMLPNGDVYVEGVLNAGAGFSYVANDRIGIRFDFTGSAGAAGITFWKNDVFQAVTFSPLVLSQSAEYRFCATLGQNTDTGAKASYYLRAADQLYAAKGDSIPLDDITIPRNIQFVPVQNSYQIFGLSFTPVSFWCQFVLNTNGTMVWTKSTGDGTINGTWRLDGLADTANYEYKISYVENAPFLQGTVTAIGGANISDVWTTLSSTGVGIRCEATSPAGIGINTQSISVLVEVREIADVENKTGIMSVNMIAQGENT